MFHSATFGITVMFCVSLLLPPTFTSLQQYMGLVHASAASSSEEGYVIILPYNLTLNNHWVVALVSHNQLCQLPFNVYHYTPVCHVNYMVVPHQGTLFTDLPSIIILKGT
jgi:hypothetical protein